MIIDGHAHASGEFGNTKQLIKILNRLEVDKIVLCPGSQDKDTIPKIPRISYTPISKMKRLIFLGNKYILQHNVPDAYFEKGNELIYSLKRKYPERIIQYFWVNPTKKDAINKIEEALKLWQIKGIKLHQCLTDFTNNSSEMEELAAFAGDNDLPIFIHILSPEEVKKLVKLAKEHPKTKFTVAHLIGMEIAKKHGKGLKNLFFDISTYFIISRRRIKYAMKHFGADHVLLGSDSPFGDNNLENNIKKIKNMRISEEEKNMILGDNLAKLLKL